MQALILQHLSFYEKPFRQVKPMSLLTRAVSRQHSSPGCKDYMPLWPIGGRKGALNNHNCHRGECAAE